MFCPACNYITLNLWLWLFSLFKEDNFLFGIFLGKAMYVPLIANVTKINYNIMGILGFIKFACSSYFKHIILKLSRLGLLTYLPRPTLFTYLHKCDMSTSYWP
jgi:hypothetical protein